MIIERLTKLIRNGSNKDRYDHLHYRTAAVYSDAGNHEKTIYHLQESITTSNSDAFQKGLSFKELGETYLLHKNYTAADIFYDSAVALIPIDYSEYDAIVFRSEVIEEVAELAKIIATTDSLLLLSTMTEKDLQLYLAELAQKQKEVNKKRNKKGGVTDFINEAITVETGGIITSGSWYFYNPNLRSQGYIDFKSVWGDRPLEYDWRRRNKAAVFNIPDVSIIDQQENIIVEVVEENKVFLKIPQTESEIAEAHNTLSESYYEIGTLFRNKLEINSEARLAFENLVNKYPEFSNIDRVYYYLYLIYTEEQDQARAEHYKNILLNEYPASQYVYAINNAYKRSTGEERPEPPQIAKLYASTYDMFLDGRYQEVIVRRNEAFEVYKENPLMPKFDFLEALSYGHLDSLAQLKNKRSPACLGTTS